MIATSEFIRGYTEMIILSLLYKKAANENINLFKLTAFILYII